MAEPSKRIWPWKKKPQDKAGLAPESSVESSPRASPDPHNSKFFDEQDVSNILADHARVSDEAMTQWHHSELKLKQMSEKLNATEKESETKDILVKQHAKVAEEAVSGWEKAEAEAALLKQQLDTALYQKLATEDRVSHLDGALKECMKQLRHVREEQEQRIHETIVKKTRENDKLRQEMEVKLTEIDTHLQDAQSQLLESRAEARAISNALDENRKVLADVNVSKARFEAEVRVLRVRLESTEKENASSKYEQQVLRKELEIRNDETEYERRATENAGKNLVESAEKIVKLEAECQRLRVLVRRKLPGPAALAQMKAEVGALDSNGSNSNSSGVFDPKRRRSSGGRRGVYSSPRDSETFLDSPMGSPRVGFSDGEAEVLVLAERLAGMDDELKMLKEALVRKDGELQVSRLMCAKTASKLSDVEEQLESALKRGNRGSVNTSWVSQKEGGLRIGDEVVDPWDAASALLAELDQFRNAPDTGLTGGKLDLMDDFAEMERLAMSTGKEELGNVGNFGEATSKRSSSGVAAAAFEEKLMVKERELAEANRLCQETSRRLSEAEEKLVALQSRNSANDAVLITLQEKLDSFSDEKQEGEREDDAARDLNITKELEDLVEAQSISLRAGAANEANLYDFEEGLRNDEGVSDGILRSMTSTSSSDSEVKFEAHEDLASVLSDANSKASTMESDLLATVRRVVTVIAALVEVSCSEHELSTFDIEHQSGLVPDRQVHHFMQWKYSDLYSGMQSLIESSNRLLQGKADVVEFLVELTAVLNYLVSFHAQNVDKIVEGVQSPLDCATGRENEEEFRRVDAEQTQTPLESDEMGAMEEEAHTPKMGRVKDGELDPASKRLEGMTNHFQEAENGPTGQNGHRDGKERKWSASRSEHGRDCHP